MALPQRDQTATEPLRETAFCRRVAEYEALGRVERVSLDQQHAQAGERLPAPTNGGAGLVRTEMKLDIEPLRGTREVFLRPSLVKPRKIGEAEKTIALGQIELEWSAILQMGVVHENRLPRATGLVPSLEGNTLDGNVALVFSRRLELATIVELRRRRKRVRRMARTDLLGCEEPPVLLHHARDGVDLCLLERRFEPHTAHRGAVLPRGLDDVEARGALRIGVVEHETLVAARQAVVEREPLRNIRSIWPEVALAVMSRIAL